MKVLKTKHEGTTLETPREIEISEATWNNNPGNIKTRMGLIRPDEIERDNTVLKNQEGETISRTDEVPGPAPQKPESEPAPTQQAPELEDIQDMNVNMARTFLRQIPVELLDAYIAQEESGKNRVSIINYIKELKNEA